MDNVYDVSKQKGSSRWYAHLVQTPNVPASRFADKKTALHDAASLMGMSYKDYMDWRRKRGCA